MNMKQGSVKNIDFPIMLGGLLYQFYIRIGLLKPPLDLYKRRIIVVALISWLPLLLLALLEGSAFGGVNVPFIFDLDTHVRFLISLGLLIGSEVMIHKYMQVIVRQFIERNIITQDVRAKFDLMIASVIKLSNSYVAELLLLILIYTVGHFIWIQHSALSISTWYVNIINGQAALTMAGYWYVYCSIPIFQFILCRWYYRIFIWHRFLWQVSRLPLQLNSLHPDRAGGLGFLSMSVSAFKIGLVAHTALLSGVIFNRIWHAGEAPLDFKLEIISILLFLLFLMLTPLVFFMISLDRAKRKGLIEYGIVACDYVNEFYAKWIRKEQNKNTVLLGSPDIQSLADLSHSFNVVNEMRLVPFDRATIIEFLLLTVLPLCPLLFTIIPLNRMLDKVIQILF